MLLYHRVANFDQRRNRQPLQVAIDNQIAHTDRGLTFMFSLCAGTAIQRDIRN